MVSAENKWTWIFVEDEFKFKLAIFCNALQFLQDILDVTLIAACGPPGGGRNPVSPRLLKHFW